MAEIPIDIQDVDSTDSSIKKLIKDDVRNNVLYEDYFINKLFNTTDVGTGLLISILL